MHLDSKSINVENWKTFKKIKIVTFIKSEKIWAQTTFKTNLLDLNENITFLGRSQRMTDESYEMRKVQKMIEVIYIPVLRVSLYCRSVWHAGRGVISVCINYSYQSSCHHPDQPGQRGQEAYKIIAVGSKLSALVVWCACVVTSICASSVCVGRIQAVCAR